MGVTREYGGHVLVRDGLNGADWKCQRCGVFRVIHETDDITVEDYSTRGPGYVVTYGRHGSVTVSEGHRALSVGCYVSVHVGHRIPRHEGRDWREHLFAEAIAIVAGWGEP